MEILDSIVALKEAKQAVEQARVVLVSERDGLKTDAAKIRKRLAEINTLLRVRQGGPRKPKLEAAPEPAKAKA